MTRVVDWFRVTKNRAWLYRGLAAAGAIGASYGYVSDTQVALWLGFAATLLGTGTAAANTSTKNEAGAVNWLAVIALCAVVLLAYVLWTSPLHVGWGR